MAVVILVVEYVESTFLVVEVKTVANDVAESVHENEALVLALVKPVSEVIRTGRLVLVPLVRRILDSARPFVMESAEHIVQAAVFYNIPPNFLGEWPVYTDLEVPRRTTEDNRDAGVAWRGEGMF